MGAGVSLDKDNQGLLADSNRRAYTKNVTPQWTTRIAPTPTSRASTTSGQSEISVEADDTPETGEATQRLWRAVIQGDISEVEAALKCGAKVDKHVFIPGEPPFVFKYKSRVVRSYTALHFAAYFQPSHKAAVEEARELWGRWHDESADRPFLDGKVVEISRDGWRVEGKEARDFKRDKHNPFTFIEERADGTKCVYEMEAADFGNILVKTQSGTASEVLPPSSPDEGHFVLHPVGMESRMSGRRLVFSAHKMVSLLLDHKANVNAEAVVPGMAGDRKDRILWAIHFAAAAGHVEVINLLVAHRADPNQEACKVDKKGARTMQYKPIHDAVWFNRLKSVEALVAHGANIDAKNNHDQTGLHLAAWLGNVDMVSLFLEMSRKDGNTEEMLKDVAMGFDKGPGGTPLEFAIQEGRFPPNQLHLFTQALPQGEDRVEAFLKVAATCPSAASELLRDQRAVSEDGSDVKTISAEWCRSLQEGAAKKAGNVLGVGTLALLIQKAPRSALDLLDALTDTPKAESVQHHPLPIRARLPRKSGMCPVLFAYEVHDEWLFCEPMLPWHGRLAPPDQKGQEVQVRIVRMKGIADLQVLHALALVRDQRIFAKMAIHALLNFVWSRLQFLYVIDFALQVSAVLVLGVWVLASGDLFEMQAVRLVLWCVFTAQGMHQVLSFLLGVVVSALHLGFNRTWKRMFHLNTWGILLFGGMTLFLAFLAYPGLWPDGDWSSATLAVNCLLHWSQLLFQLRAFRWAGQRLLPILMSIRPISGMLVIMGNLMMAFVFGFWAINQGSATADTFFDVVYMLLAGEVFFSPESLDDVMAGQRYFFNALALGALFVFLNCALSLFIAVLGDCYNREQERMIFTFLLERARITCTLYSGPAWELQWRWAIPLLLICSALWVLSLAAAAAIPDLPSERWFQLLAWVPPLLLNILVVLLQAILRGHLVAGWGERYLWMCHAPKMEVQTMLMAPDEFDSLEDAEGARNMRLKTYILEQNKLARQDARDDIDTLMHQVRNLNLTIRADILNKVGALHTEVSGIQSRQGDQPGSCGCCESVLKSIHSIQDRQEQQQRACDSMRASIESLLVMVRKLEQRTRKSDVGTTTIDGSPPLPPPAQEPAASGLPRPTAPPVEPQIQSPATTGEGAAVPSTPVLGGVGQPATTLWLNGCSGKYGILNGVYELRRTAHLGRPAWTLASRDRELHLFHNGRSRWVLSRRFGDASSCYAYLDDEGQCSPLLCRGPWFRCDEKGRWAAEQSFRCQYLPVDSSLDWR